MSIEYGRPPAGAAVCEHRIRETPARLKGAPAARQEETEGRDPKGPGWRRCCADCFCPADRFTQKTACVRVCARACVCVCVCVCVIENNGMLSDLHVYDPALKAWADLSAAAAGAAPPPRDALGFAAAGGLLYLYGGWGVDGEMGGGGSK